MPPGANIEQMSLFIAPIQLTAPHTAPIDRGSVHIITLFTKIVHLSSAFITSFVVRLLWAYTGTARIVCGAGSIRYDVRLSVPAWAPSSKPAAAGLLLRARRAGDIDRLLQQRRANTDSATLSAYVGS